MYLCPMVNVSRDGWNGWMAGVTHERASRFEEPRARTNMANPMVRMPDGRLIVRAARAMRFLSLVSFGFKMRA